MGNITTNGLEDFKDIKDSLNKDGELLLGTILSDKGHLGDIIAELNMIISSINIKKNKLIDIFNLQKGDNTIYLNGYGPIIVHNEDVINKIYDKIKERLYQDDELNKVVIDFDGIGAISTEFCKKVFGRLYNEMSSRNYFTYISIINSSDDIKQSILWGIQYYLEENKQL